MYIIYSLKSCGTPRIVLIIVIGNHCSKGKINREKKKKRRNIPNLLSNTLCSGFVYPPLHTHTESTFASNISGLHGTLLKKSDTFMSPKKAKFNWTV